GSPGLADGARAAAPGLALFSANKVLLAVVNGLGRMRAFAVYQSLRYVLMPAGVLAAKGLGLPGSQVAFLFTFAEGLLFLALLVEHAVVVGFRGSGHARWLGVHLRYGAKSVLGGMILELNTRLDVLMLGFFLATDGPIGVYSLAVAFAEGVLQLLVVLQNNYNPLLARYLAAGDRAELLRLVARGKRLARLLVGGAGGVAVLAFPLAAELLMGNPEYRAGWLPFGVLVGGLFLSAGWLPFGQVLLMGGRPAWHTTYMAGALVANAIGNALLIPQLGLAGAALGTSLSFLASGLLLAWLCRRELALRL
ncbi:MAG TPA: polysaccharide biosynthesis C-terminal domain-containing protein, partial [Planctomycetota bacterium]|nr:polysaccharide biosynthesis C-terminal domain-containing protein [Planctomycetota bacterium]